MKKPLVLLLVFVLLLPLPVRAAGPEVNAKAALLM